MPLMSIEKNGPNLDMSMITAGPALGMPRSDRTYYSRLTFNQLFNRHYRILGSCLPPTSNEYHPPSTPSLSLIYCSETPSPSYLELILSSSQSSSFWNYLSQQASPLFSCQKMTFFSSQGEVQEVLQFQGFNHTCPRILWLSAYILLSDVPIVTYTPIFFVQGVCPTHCLSVLPSLLYLVLGFCL